jgi:hypothetical protein
MTYRRRLFHLTAIALLLPTSPLRAQERSAALQSITAAELRDHIHYLASDFLEGRDAHEKGYMLAAEYGAVHFRAAGLVPMFTDSAGGPSYFQQVRFEKTTVNSASGLRVTIGGAERKYRFGEEFFAQAVFPSGTGDPIEGTPVFLGYGIEEPELGWNDYEGVDVAGKIALVVAGAPMRDGKPVFPEEVHQRYSSLLRSGNAVAMRAIDRQVSTLILVPDAEFMSMWDPIVASSQQPSVRPVSPGTQGDGAQTSWFIGVKPEVAADMLAGAGYDLTDESGKYTPGPLEGVHVTIDLRHDLVDSFTSPNVVGVLPGTDPVLKDEYIVVTAHLDHVGIQGGEVFNGADDNASGSAAVIEAAEAAGMVPGKRSIVFVLLTSEEDGLLGARYFADNPPVPIEQIVLNINLDMVGRNSPEFPEVLLALGSENRRPELLQLIRSVNESVGANLDWRLNEGEDPHSHVQRSDQMAFMQKDVPAILITRGFMGPDYHQASDDPETINYEKVLQAARLAFALAVEAANREVLFQQE